MGEVQQADDPESRCSHSHQSTTTTHSRPQRLPFVVLCSLEQPKVAAPRKSNENTRCESFHGTPLDHNKLRSGHNLRNPHEKQLARCINYTTGCDTFDAHMPMTSN